METIGTQSFQQFCPTIKLVVIREKEDEGMENCATQRRSVVVIPKLKMVNKWGKKCSFNVDDVAVPFFRDLDLSKPQLFTLLIFSV